MENSHKILIGLIGLTFLFTVGNFVVLITRNQVPVIGEDIALESEAVRDEIGEVVQNEVAGEIAGELLVYSHDNGLIFNYPAGWHIFERNIFDDASRVTPLHEIFINEDPINYLSPSGGPAIWSRIYIRSLDMGEAIYAPYEGEDWEEYLRDAF